MTSWEVREVSLEVVDDLCRKHHGYGGSGKVAAYSFGVYEGDRLVAAYAWQPPPPGAAKKVCPEAPSGVLGASGDFGKSVAKRGAGPSSGSGGSMRIGSLFSGIGGLELGLEQSGLGRVVWQVEIDVGCRSVLAAWWPSVNREVVDVRNAKRSCLEEVEIVCGGFPCQDVSSAGKRAGLGGERSGLWYEYARVLGEFLPEWAIVENVASGATRWLSLVRHDLSALGYRSAAIELSAADIGAPHRRQRVFVVAHRDGGRRASERLPVQRGGHARESRNQPDRCGGEDGQRGKGARRSAEPGLGRGPDGVPGRVDRWPAGPGTSQASWEPPRVIKRTRGGNRTPRLKALGNAVVPGCAYVIGDLIRSGAIHSVLEDE